MIDWLTIRRRYEAGESSYKISVSLGNKPTRQGITKRAERENWGNQTDNSTVTAVGSGNWLERVGKYDPVGVKDRPATRALILQLLAEGMPKSSAAELAGVNRDTLLNWSSKDAAFSAMLTQAQQEWHRKRLKSVERAADAGDAATGRWLLERHPATREHYKPSAGSSGANVAIQINTGIEPRIKVDETA